MKNINYPEKARTCFDESTEVAQFTVTTGGNVADFKIINSVCTDVDDEIIRALKKTNVNLILFCLNLLLNADRSCRCCQVCNTNRPFSVGNKKQNLKARPPLIANNELKIKFLY